MSDRSRDWPHRSVHVVPGSNTRFLAKAPSLGADAYILDLEDAVAPSEKARARSNVVEAIVGQSWGSAVLSVRVNGWESPWVREDLVSIVEGAGDRIDAVVLPKVESRAEVVKLDAALTDLEDHIGLPRGNIGIDVLIESARGLVEVHAILASTSRLETVTFGPLDFAASIGMPSLAIGQAPSPTVEAALANVRTKILIAGRAAGLLVIDGPYFTLEDEAGLRQAARVVADLGFDGKWSIHPSQIKTLNEEFSPDAASLERALNLIQRLNEATDLQASGAIRFEGAMVDEATRRLALSLVRRGQRADSSRSDPVTP